MDQEDENCLQIEDLPVEMMVENFSHWPQPNMFSWVVRRLLGWPQEKNQDFQNLIMRFPRLKNIELTTKITNKDMNQNSYDFDGTTMEFDINQDIYLDQVLIQSKNPEVAFIKRIKIEPANVKDFEYKEDQIMSFEINMIHDDYRSHSAYPRWDSVIEEIRSLDNVSKIEYTEDFQQGKVFLVKLIRSILSRPYLKQIIFHVRECHHNYLDIEEEFPKNQNVEEITFKTCAPSFKFLNKVLDALPNIKKVEIFNDKDFENLPVFLKNISGLKHLKSLYIAISGISRKQRFWSNDDFDTHKLEHILEIIKNNFPMNSEIVIADLWWPNHLTNLIKKKEGEDPKIVYDTLYDSYFSFSEF